MAPPSTHQYSSRGVNDRPVSEDALGFEPYVQAVKEFLAHPQTEQPLTVSVEGAWGSGKSSFLRQLERAFRADGLTVRFNPWRYEGQDEIWAAFALSVIGQLRRHHSVPWWQRWRGDVSLALDRLEWERERSGVLLSTLLLLSVLTLAVLSSLLLVVLGQTGVFVAVTATLGPGATESRLVQLAAGGGGLTVASTVFLLAWRRLRTWVLAPLRTEIERYVADPNYEKQLSLLTRFHEDFGRIINAYAGTTPVYVFIDDLDRCSPPTAATLMESINLLIGDAPSLTVVVAMDREKVAASIAAKHGELLPYLVTAPQIDSPVDGEADKTPKHGVYDEEYIRGVEFGNRYLEKFIQVPLLIPTPQEDVMAQFIQRLTTDHEPEERPSDAEASHVDASLLARVAEKEAETLRQVTETVAAALDFNPRQLKKFLNLYRLRVQIATRTGLVAFEGSGTTYTPESLTLQQLAKFVAISIRWPRLVWELRVSPTLLGDLERYAIRKDSDQAVAEDVADDEETPDWSPDPDVRAWLRHWSSDKSLVSLVTYGLDRVDGEQYSMQGVRVGNLLRISSHMLGTTVDGVIFRLTGVGYFLPTPDAEGAPGDDDRKHPGWYIRLNNLGDDPVDLGGVTIETTGGETLYSFPSTDTLEPGTQVTLYSGTGVETESMRFTGIPPKTDPLVREKSGRVEVRRSTGELLTTIWVIDSESGTHAEGLGRRRWFYGAPPTAQGFETLGPAARIVAGLPLNPVINTTDGIPRDHPDATGSESTELDSDTRDSVDQDAQESSDPDSLSE